MNRIKPIGRIDIVEMDGFGEAAVVAMGGEIMENWPFLKKYEGEYLRRIALPLGGIGTGTVSLGGRGNLQDWAIMNSPAMGYTPQLMEGARDVGPFFCLYTEQGDQRKITALEGKINTEHYQGSQGSRTANHGLPRFTRCAFKAAYPLARIDLSDPEVPAKVSLYAFNPLIPGDSDASSLPMARLTYRVTNTTENPLTAAVCASLINHIGADGRDCERAWDNKKLVRGARDNANEFRRERDYSGLYMFSNGVDTLSPAWGTMALTVPNGGEVTHRTAWAQRTWGDSLLDFWDDFLDGGTLWERTAPEDSQAARMASLAVKRELAPGESAEYEFLLTWHFPNRQVWAPKPDASDNRVGNWYALLYKDAWEAAEKIRPGLGELERATVEFVQAFCGSDLPAEVKEAALNNVSTLRSQTVFRTETGHLFGWEGIHPYQGSCEGSCTHVWNYEQTTAFLFGDLALTMRDVEFAHALDDSGHMNFRARLPLERNKTDRWVAAADGQMGCIMKMYRDWQLSGRRDILEKYWPQVKSALSFCWLPGG